MGVKAAAWAALGVFARGGREVDAGFLGATAHRRRSNDAAVGARVGARHAGDPEPDSAPVARMAGSYSGLLQRAPAAGKKNSRPEPGESGGKCIRRQMNQCSLDQLTSFTAFCCRSKLRARMASISAESELCSIGALSSTTPQNSLPSRYCVSVRMNCV